MLTPTNEKKKSETFYQEIEALFLKFREPVLQAAYRKIGNKDDAEDVLQNVFLTLIERPEVQGDFCENPFNYLYTAAINQALKIYRTRERRKLTDEAIDALEIPAPELEVDRVDDIQKVRAAMVTLSHDKQEILHLHYYEGYTCREIAKIRRKPTGSVLWDLSRARAELKKAILRQEKQSETKEKKHEGTRSTVDTETSEA